MNRVADLYYTTDLHERRIPFLNKIEAEFQANLKKKLTKMFPGCIILKNDPTYIQGIPDLTVLWKNKWALLECKRESEARRRPNQIYYVNLGNQMSFARSLREGTRF